MPSGAVSPAEPVTGLMMAKPPPILPDAVHAAACQQLISLMVEDERKNPRLLSPQLKSY